MRLDPNLYALSERQHSLISRAQCRQLGMRGHEIDRLMAREWVPISRHVFQRRGATRTSGTRFLSLVLDRGGDAALSHAAAAEWWGLPGYDDTCPNVITTRHSRRRSDLGLVHVVRRVPEPWVTVHRGIRIVRPELVVLHLCATEHPQRAERALDNAWNLRLLSGRSIVACVADVGRMGRNGTALLRRLVDARGPDYTPPASNLERRAIEVLEPLRLDFRRQVDLGGEVWDGRVDLVAERLPLIVEVQSERYHSSLCDRAADEIRRAKLEAGGFTVVEVWDTEIWAKPGVVRDRVRAARRSLH